MDRDGVESWEILVGADGFARIYWQRNDGATSWGELLIPKHQLESAWRNYLRAGD